MLATRVTGKVTGKVMPLLGGCKKLDCCKSLILLVPKEGVEPSWPQRPRDFESRTHIFDIVRNSPKELETEEDSRHRRYEAVMRILKDYEGVCNELVMNRSPALPEEILGNPSLSMYASERESGRTGWTALACGGVCSG